jgi:hypothetical protein
MAIAPAKPDVARMAVMARDRRFYDSFKDESGTIYVSDVLLPDQIVFTISFTSQPQKCSALAAEQMAFYM